MEEVTKKRHSIGTDPEFIITNEHGRPVNAEHLFPGTKLEPHPLESGSGLQTDNVAVEFASAVAHNPEDLIANIRATFKEISSMLPKGHNFDAVPSAEFEDSELKSDQAQKFGCDASYCAWDLKEKDQPNAMNTNMRSTGGHIHVGKTEGDGNDFLLEPFGKTDTVKTMDAFHGTISVVLDNSEASINRKQLYGQAGDHRPKSYGFEYRTLSSFWLKSPTLVMLIDALTNDVLDIVRANKHNDIIEEIGESIIRNTINNGDIETAKNIINNVLMPHLSADSRHYYEECAKNIHTYTLTKEWGL